MSKHRKSWTITEKQEIVNYFEEHGAGKASAEYDVSSTSIYKWASQIGSGVKGGCREYIRSKQDALLIKQLERKIHALQSIVADNALEIKIKNDLLKKKSSVKTIKWK